MNDIQAIQRYIAAFDTDIQSFKDEAFWNKLRTGTQWMRKTFPDSPYTEVAESYERALYTIALIKEEIIVEGGKHIDRSRKEI